MFTMLAIAAGLVIAIAVTAALVRGGITVRTAVRPAFLPPDLADLDDMAFHARLQEEVAAGRKIEAIKWVRARTGYGLREAKDLVENLVATAPAPSLHRRVDEVRALDETEFHARLLLELAAGRRIEAIQLYRGRNEVGLKEAIDAIEALERGG